MNEDQNISSLEDKALDIVNAGAAITDAQLEELRENDELRREVSELQQLGAYVRQQGKPIDVEARLKRFHSRNENGGGKSSLSFLRSYHILILAAAVFIGILFVIRPTHKPVQETASQEIVFTGTESQTGITLTTPKGERVMLSVATQQNISLTLDDFRKLLSEEKKAESVTLEIPVGKSADFTLPDGSVVYLHPDSRISFPVAFTGDKRVVLLEGQAYFKVAKDKSHPFVVMTDDIHTTVLGTEFYIDTKNREVVLVSGSVRVDADKASETLAPGQKTILNEMHTAFDVLPTDTEPYKYWRDGYLYFNNVELKDIMEAIGANFNMTVEFRNIEALHYRMRFITERNNGIDAAIDMMNQMKKVKVHKSGNKIFVD